jgi:RNA polymerase sigma-70 factor (TIGR02943 family)
MHEDINSDLWVDRYGDMLYRYTLVRVKNPDAAEEIVQVTLLAALQAKKSFQGRSTEKSWLFGILKHKILDHFRDLKTRRTFELTPEDDSDPLENAYHSDGHWANTPKNWDTDPHKAVENKQLVAAMAECLDRLSDKFRNIFVLKEIEGLTSDEICKEMDIKPTNLWVILHRARNQLRKCLETHHWDTKK